MKTIFETVTGHRVIHAGLASAHLACFIGWLDKPAMLLTAGALYLLMVIAR